MKTYRLFLLWALLFTVGAWAPARAADNPALWRHYAKGEFGNVIKGLKTSLQAAQFQITAEEHLSKGLEKNKDLFPKDQWNTIGFDNVAAIHFCSVVFNQEVFNIDLDWSILCPFKLVAYTTKAAPKDVTIVIVRPTYIMAPDKHKKAADVAKRIEERIITAIREASAP